MTKHSQEFQEVKNPLANLQEDYFSAPAKDTQDPLDNVDVKDIGFHPAKKLLLTPGNDLKVHQKQIVGIVQKKLAFNNPQNEFVVSPDKETME